MKRTAAAFVVGLASVIAPAASGQDASAPPSIEQVRAAFRESVELCAQSVQRGKHFEDLLEAAGKLAQSPVVRPVSGTDPKPDARAFHDDWHVPGFNPFQIFQDTNACTVTWHAKPWGATEATDLSVERGPAIVHATGLLQGATELPFYEADGAVGARFVVAEGGRSLPFFVALWKSGDLSVAINVVPPPSSVLPKPFGIFESRCLRSLYAGLKLEPYPFELDRADTSLQTASGFIFYGNSRFGRIGLNPTDPKRCAFHEPALKLVDVGRAIPAVQWGLELSVGAAPRGGVIVVVRAP